MPIKSPASWKMKKATHKTLHNGRAGEQLKARRIRLGLTTRQVEEISRRIAAKEKKADFYISNAWLTQPENQSRVPSICKLYSISIIYGLNFNDVLCLYGVDLERIGKHRSNTRLPNTHITSIHPTD